MTNSTLLQLSTRRMSKTDSNVTSPRYLPDIEPLNSATVALIRHEFVRRNVPWFLGFSGGKDSSALLKLTYQALMSLDRRTDRRLTVVYCDTGVDVPLVASLVRRTLRRLKAEAKADSVPLAVAIARPPLADRYFVKVIGRGYPPPSNKFRWCTDRLRINPVRRVLRSGRGDERIVLLGVRHGESAQRDRTLRKHAGEGEYYLRQTGQRGTFIFSPILNYRVEDVWATIEQSAPPFCIDGPRLTKLYKEAGGECPSIRDPHGTPCGKGRFGCWTCTVVRKDHAMTSMIAEGHTELTPLLRWRDWLMTIRDEPTYRCEVRRNGALGPGPFTLRARREILRRLLAAEKQSPWKLISAPEIDIIRQLWKSDMHSATYVE